MMDAAIGILGLLGIVIALIAAISGMQRLNDYTSHSIPDRQRGIKPWLREIATALPKVLVTTAVIGAVIAAIFVGVALLPPSNREVVGAVLIMLLIFVPAGIFGRWMWRTRIRSTRHLQPWEHPSVTYRQDEPPQQSGRQG